MLKVLLKTSFWIQLSLARMEKKLKKKLLRFYLLVKNAMVIVSAHVHELNSLTVLLLAGQTQR